MYAEILIEYPTKKIDKYFTYLIPEDLRSIINIGMKVKVPFGNKIINGFVMNISDDYDSLYSLKELVDIVDQELILSKELMDLGKFVQEKTLCPLISAYQTMLPSSLKIKNNETNYNFYKTYIELNKPDDEIVKYLKIYNKTNKQSELLNELLAKKRLLKKECSLSSIKSLKEKELIKEVKEQEYRIKKETKYEITKHKLNEEQQNAFNMINDCNDNTTFLLEGVTGSGKTEVYLNLIDACINKGKTAILLVPEIGLTMQIINRFYEWFGSSVAVFHSALSNGEKYDEYLKIIRGEVSVVIGTRSAIFTPLKNIGLIIIDEEHSDTYKQDNMPRYNAIDIAKERCKYHQAPLLLGSATPTLETRARALKGVYKYIKLSKRAGSGTLPNVQIIDMVEEVKKKNFIFSEELKNKINENLDKKEQIIILLNRRGYSTTINCSNCGFTYKCPNCHEDGLNYLGVGTEKVELEINKLFPMARVIRMDQDTTSKKGAHEKIIKDFRNLKYDILLGTQMISKGLDFPKVTLVGILNADSSLNIPDFRSNEKTFSLLYQASGRAGRGNLTGDVIIQTYNPDNFVINCVKKKDFNSFYNYEMDIRRILKYPPYYFLVSLKIISSDYNLALENATKVSEYLKKNIDNSSIILGPTTASLFKLNNNYRFQIVIKYRFDNKLINTLKNLDDIYINDNKVNLEIDIDPLHI